LFSPFFCLFYFFGTEIVNQPKTKQIVMDNLELRYNDVELFEITDTLQKSFVNSIKQSIERALKPVKKELENSDGFVRINYKGDKLEITAFYLPTHLEEKINRILK
jgi:hypothetical protein